MGFVRSFGRTALPVQPAALTELPVPADSDRVVSDVADEPASPDLVDQWLARQGDLPAQPKSPKPEPVGDPEVDAFLGDDIMQRAPLSKEVPSEVLLKSECVSRLIH